MLEDILEIHQEILSRIKSAFIRYLYAKCNWKAKGICILGDRGVGKTTLLCQDLLKRYKTPDRALYISADHILVISYGLFELARDFFAKGGEALYIDEVHKYPEWSVEIKNILDTYKDKQIIFSASSSLDLTKSKGDLSRRVIYYRLEGLSFREYLELTENVTLGVLSLEEILKHHVQVASALNGIPILKLFANYLEHGYYPFFLEGVEDYTVRDSKIGISRSRRPRFRPGDSRRRSSACVYTGGAQRLCENVQWTFESWDGSMLPAGGEMQVGRKIGMPTQRKPIFESRAVYTLKVQNVIEKVLFEDLAVVYNLKQSTLPILKRILWLVATSNGLTPNVDKISKNLGVSRETVYNCLEYLSHSGLLNLLATSGKGNALVRKPGKIYLSNTSLLAAIMGSLKIAKDIGSVRETFFVNQVSQYHKVIPHDHGDYLVDDKYVIEIGGRGKTGKQIHGQADAYIAIDDAVIGFGNRIPLYLFGFLY